MNIKLKNKTLAISKKTLVMGILNVTPDSFSDGGEWFGSVDRATDRAKQMIDEGVDIIDVGGESTRPGSERISEKDELKRVIPVIKKIREKLGPEIIVSIDTYKAHVAKEGVEIGADIINDVSGLQLDQDMPKIVCQTGAGIVVNHMLGTPKTMQQGEIVYKDIILEINTFFKEKLEVLKKAGVAKNQVILDPGFGFGKNPTHNIEILKRLHEFSKFNLPILIGLSRKNTLGVILKETFGREFMPKERIESGLAGAAIAVMNGASIVRTHDVLETKKFLSVLDKIRVS